MGRRQGRKCALNISEIFIRRPIATSLLMLAIALFGALAYLALPVSDMPNVDMPTLNVSAGLAGANPETMASAVATPLERQFTTIAGIDSMISSNSQGSTQITLQFDLNRSIDGAAVDVVTAISEAMPLLPAGMPAPPSFRKSNPASSPILMLALTSSTLPLYELDDYAEVTMAEPISMVNGVADVQIFGSTKYAVRVQVDPEKLFAKKIGINEVDSALRRWNVNIPTGTLYGPHQAYNIRATGQLMNAADFRPAIIAYRNRAPVRLEEVAHVIDDVENNKNASWFVTKTGSPRAINLMVLRQPGSNVIEVADEVKQLIPSLQNLLPPSVQLNIRGDLSKNIREAFRDIKMTMAVTLGLVILVIFIFLRNASATMIPSMALPLSILATFSVIYMLDFTLDNMSMMALILCIGFVVDDAIVMLENIVRHIEKGEQPLQAALNGSKEIGFTIVSMTLSLAAVFIPILFMSGILGRLFREFAVTITIAILASGLVSITLTPMLCSRFLRPIKNANKRSGRLFKGMLHFYDLSLQWVLRHRPVMIVIFFVVLGATVYMYSIVPKGFIPDVDNDQLSCNMEAAQGTSFYQMKLYAEKLTSILREDEYIDAIIPSVGNSNSSRFQIQLRPRAKRDLTAAQVAEKLRPKVSRIPGIRAFVSVPPAIRIGGRMSKSSYDFTIQSPDTAELYREAQKLEREIIDKIPVIQDVTSDLQIKTPRINVELDRDKAAALQLNMVQVQNSLYDAFGPQWSSTIYGAKNQYRVLLEILPKFQEYADYLTLLHFKTPAGNLVPLNTFVKLRNDVMPQTINHSGQLPSVTISFNLRPGTSLGEATSRIKEVADQTLPPRMTTSFQGTAKTFLDSLNNLGLLLGIAVMVVYIVLGMLYESYVHPLTILSGLPSAGFGALLILLIFKVELNIYSFVGLIMLIGIVKKNAIMQIDFALEAERKEGKTPAEAIYEGCLIRFRPIMMTTMAGLLGALPISLGLGAGGEARRPLGITVVGGLLFSQMITLYLTPVIYTYMTQLVRWVRWLRSWFWLRVFEEVVPR
jgi:hydrophobic/amphiphilic exporter-1 (mainly G- bacteria), HAE1 family